MAFSKNYRSGHVAKCYESPEVALEVVWKTLENAVSQWAGQTIGAFQELEEDLAHLFRDLFDPLNLTLGPDILIRFLLLLFAALTNFFNALASLPFTLAFEGLGRVLPIPCGLSSTCLSTAAHARHLLECSASALASVITGNAPANYRAYKLIKTKLFFRDQFLRLKRGAVLEFIFKRFGNAAGLLWRSIGQAGFKILFGIFGVVVLVTLVEITYSGRINEYNFGQSKKKHTRRGKYRTREFRA